MISLRDIGRFYGETVQAARNMKDAVYDECQKAEPDLLLLKAKIDVNMGTIEALYQTLQAEKGKILL